jgi:hypothetical protein
MVVAHPMNDCLTCEEFMALHEQTYSSELGGYIIPDSLQKGFLLHISVEHTVEWERILSAVEQMKANPNWFEEEMPNGTDHQA